MEVSDYRALKEQGENRLCRWALQRRIIFRTVACHWVKLKERRRLP